MAFSASIENKKTFGVLFDNFGSGIGIGVGIQI